MFRVYINKIIILRWERISNTWINGTGKRGQIVKALSTKAGVCFPDEGENWLYRIVLRTWAVADVFIHIYNNNNEERTLKNSKVSCDGVNLCCLHRPRNQRQADLYELEASLIYLRSSRPAGAAQQGLVAINK